MREFLCYFRYGHLDFDIEKARHCSETVSDWHMQSSSDQAKAVDFVGINRWAILVGIHDLLQGEICVVVVFQVVIERKYSLHLELALGGDLYLLAGQ